MKVCLHHGSHYNLFIFHRNEARFLQIIPQILKNLSMNAADDWIFSKIVANLYNSGSILSWYLQNRELLSFILFSKRIFHSLSTSNWTVWYLKLASFRWMNSLFCSSSANNSSKEQSESIYDGVINQVGGLLTFSTLCC